MYVSGVKRGSGCTLTDVILKTGPEMREQGQRMARLPAVFAPVLAITAAGYVMPRLRADTYLMDTVDALRRLTRLWNLGRIRWQQPVASRTAYRDYVRSRSVPERLRQLEEKVWLRTRLLTGTACEELHGDCTLENIVCLSDGTSRWIDPDVNPYVVRPHEAELDAGKLLQSLYGYGCEAGSDGPQGHKVAARRFLSEETDLVPALSQYYFITHLIRLYPHQPQAQAWALRTAESVANEF